MPNNTITLKGTGVRNEHQAVAAITPGNLVEFTSAGKVQKHSGAGLVAEKAFAVENDLIGADIADDYATDSQVQYNIFRPGDEVYALLANGENASKGSFLESNGDGELRVVDTDSSALTVKPGSIIAVSLAALNMSGSSLVDPASNRLPIRIL